MYTYIGPETGSSSAAVNEVHKEKLEAKRIKEKKLDL